MAMAGEKITQDGASCRLYREAPTWDGAKTASVGAFACKSVEAGTALLQQVTRQLTDEGFEAVIGPMDGDTWHTYRLVLESDGSPAFFLEPTCEPWEEEAFRRAGFHPVATYVSARVTVDNIPAAAQPAASGLSLETWDGSDTNGFLRKVHTLSLNAFSQNPFYKPISEAAFFALYRPVVPFMDRRFILFVRDNAGDFVGFSFAIPNVLEGTSPRALIYKTYASVRRGAGHMMLDAIHNRAREFGFKAVIHALMNETNISLDRSARHNGEIFRRYALMGKKL